MLLWCATSIVLVAYASGRLLTVAVVVPCVLFAPGIVMVCLLRLRGVALVITIVILVAVAAGVLVPSALLYAGAWSPRGAFALTIASTLSVAAGGILRRTGRARGQLLGPGNPGP